MLNKYFYILFFPASLWLKDHNENKAIRLFCVILAILFFISLILLLTSTFLLLLLLLLLLFVVNFFFFKVWLFIFFVPIWIFCFHGKIKLTYVLTYLLTYILTYVLTYLLPMLGCHVIDQRKRYKTIFLVSLNAARTLSKKMFKLFCTKIVQAVIC